MSGPIITLLLGAGIVWLLSRSKRTAAPVPTEPRCPKPGSRILLIGDSLAVGLGPRLKAFAEKCELEGVDIAFDTTAEVGSHATQWEKWLGSRALSNWHGLHGQEPPNIIVVSLGGNDYKLTNPQVMRESVSEIAAQIRDLDAKLLWIAPPPMPIADTAGARQAWLDEVDLTSHDWFDTPSVPFPQAPDRIHPTPAGYDQLAASVWKWIKGRSFYA